MQLLAKPPKFTLTQECINQFLARLKRAEVQEYLGQANHEYYHWEKLRHRPTPKGLTPEQAWNLGKWLRLGRAQPLPLRDANGRAFSFWLPDQALAVLHEVDRRGGSFLAMDEKAAPSLSALRDRVLVSSLMEEAIATSQIEGAVTTRKVAKEMLRTNRKPRDRGEQMIVNSYRTILHLRERLEQPLTISLLNEI